jgi:hypothetical protein
MPDGQHFLSIFAQDIIGTWQFLQFSFITDGTPPLILLNNPTNKSLHQSGTIIDLTVTGSNGTLIYHWDTGNNQTLADVFDPVLPVGDGLHQLFLYVLDDVGNFNFTYLEFITDDTAPQITLVSDIDLNETAFLPAVQIQFTIHEIHLEHVWFNWDGESAQFINDPFNVSVPSSEGWHDLIINANDSVGLLSSFYYRFYIDTSAPIISLLSPLNGTQITLNTFIQLNISDPFLSNVTYHWDADNSAFVTILSQSQVPQLSGWHSLHITATDTVGHSESIMFSFYVNITVNYNPNDWIFPSTVYEGGKFTLELSFTNNEAITLDFVAFLLGEDDNVLEGNGTSFSLAPGQTQTLPFSVSPKHASTHTLTFIVYNEDEIVIEELIQFEVRPYFESPFIQTILMVVVAIILIFTTFIILFVVIRYNRKQHERLVSKLGAPDYKVAKQMKTGGFDDHSTFIRATDVGAKSFTDLQLVEETGAPDFITSIKVKKGGFPNYETYKKGLTKKAETFKQLKLVEKYDVADYLTAIKIEESGFPNKDTYQRALKEGFSSFDQWKLKEDRKEKLVRLIKRADRIEKTEFMNYMDFTDSKLFLDWILSLPDESPLKLDKDVITFKQQNLEDPGFLKTIDQLMQSYGIDESEITGEEITRIRNFIEEIKPDIQVTVNSIADKTNVAKNKVEQILSDLTKTEDAPGEYLSHENIFIKRSIDLESSEEGFSRYIQEMEEKRKRKRRNRNK